MIINLSGGQTTAYTDRSGRPINYWDEYYYNTSQSNAIYREFEELTYEGDDTILVGQRQLAFTGLYYNTTNGQWQTNPFIVASGSGTPRGGADEPIIIGNGEIFTGNSDGTPNTNTPTFFGGFTERKNGSARLNGTQINPYTQIYTGTTSEDRITYLKAVLKWLEVEIKSVTTQLQTDVRLLKNQTKSGDEREVKIIEAAGIALTATGGLKIPGIILSGVAQLGKFLNNSNASKVTLTESVRSKTELLNQYITDYKKFKFEYDSLTQNGGSSDSGLNSNNQIYWIIGSVVVLGIVIYFIVRNKWQ